MIKQLQGESRLNRTLCVGWGGGGAYGNLCRMALTRISYKMLSFPEKQEGRAP